MSSIYRKGRDGYFYYQAYIYNKESKKKDKRIFHSLGTRDEVEAKKQRIFLDEKYKDNDKKDQQSVKLWFFSRRSLIPIFFTTALCILILFSNKKKQISVAETSYNGKELNRLQSVMNDSIKKLKKDHLIPKENIIITTVKSPSLKKTIPLITSFNVERVEKLSDLFNQGKIHVTIDSKFSDESQRLLCTKLKNEYSEFSNIIICLYSKKPEGLKLAIGINQTINNVEQEESWLAMYTYNKVEGEYFDNDPTGFLGIN